MRWVMCAEGDFLLDLKSQKPKMLVSCSALPRTATWVRPLRIAPRDWPEACAECTVRWATLCCALYVTLPTPNYLPSLMIRHFTEQHRSTN